jgi:exopolyphosphatase
VVAIIDHHNDDKEHISASPRIIEKCGSCASLIAEHFLFTEQKKQEWKGVDKLSVAEEIGEIGKLALAAILADTANLTQKATPRDVSVVQQLEEWMCVENVWDRDTFYDGIYAAKIDIGGMELRDLMRKDYKEWTEEGKGGSGKMGVASVVKGLRWIVDQEGRDMFLDAVGKWCKERGLDVVAVMASEGQGDGFRRDLMIWGLTEGGKDCMKCFRQKAEENSLQLSSWEDGELDSQNGERAAFRQGNVAMSRKQIAPLLRECLKVAKFDGACAPTASL